MFILALIAGIILGYISKGTLRNLANINLKGTYLIIIGFIIEFVIIMLIQKKIITAGVITYIMNVIMYILILAFIFVNKKNKYIVIMGVGFMLNAIAIFANGGVMPVSSSAIETIGFSTNVHTEGLYNLINSNTNLSFLGDIIPIDFIGRFIVSIGDVIAAIGMILFIVKSMKNTI